MKMWQAIALTAVTAFFMAGLVLLISTTPTGKPIKLLPVPTQSDVMVHVDGSVLRPGVYKLQPGSRVDDAVQMAGGLTTDADVHSVNLAKIVRDGEKITIPAVCNNCDPSSITKVEKIDMPSIDAPLNINTATLEEFMQLPGIGSKIAGDIINYREEIGYFQSIDELDDVPGIGQSILKDISGLVSVE